MSREKTPGPQEPWTFAANRSLQIRKGLELTPAERLRWLEDTVEELLPWVGRARLGRPVQGAPAGKTERED
jgi:hypothetical protein